MLILRRSCFLKILDDLPGDSIVNVWFHNLSDLLDSSYDDQICHFTFFLIISVRAEITLNELFSLLPRRATFFKNSPKTVQNAHPFRKRKLLIVNVYSLSTSNAGAVISFSAFADPLTAAGISFNFLSITLIFYAASAAGL